MRRQLALICAISALITICSAGSVIFEGQDGAGRIIYQADSPERIGAYFVELQYKAPAAVQKVHETPLSGLLPTLTIPVASPK